MAIVGLSWTISGIVMGSAPRKNVNINVMLFFSALIAMIVCGILGLFEGFPIMCASKTFWITFCVLSVCGIVNYVQLFEMSAAMEKGPNGIIWSLIQSGFVFPFIVGVVFFGAKCSLVNLSGALLILVSLFILGFLKDNKSHGNWKWPTFIAFFATGLTQALCNLPSYLPDAEAISSTWRSAFVAFGLASGTVVGTFLTLKGNVCSVIGKNIHCRLMWIYCFVLEGFSILSSIFLLYPGMNLLANAGVGAIAFPLMVASCIIGFEFYAMVILKERRNLPQILALIMMLLGIIALCN
ncbi:MAG: hypothetical protein WCS73_12870 [Lentisphaeria bacterium]